MGCLKLTYYDEGVRLRPVVLNNPVRYIDPDGRDVENAGGRDPDMWELVEHKELGLAWRNKESGVVEKVDDSDLSSSWLSDIWNSTIVRVYTGDAIFVNTTFSLVFLGGGSNSSGFVLPLRGPDAFKLHFINTASFRLGAQGGWDVSAGIMWFNGPAESAYVREMNGYGASLDANLGLAYGWGPGAGVFESHNIAGRTTWFGLYGSFGFGIGGSLGFDYTYTTPVF